MVPQVDEQRFEQRTATPPEYIEPALLSPPDVLQPSANQSPPNRFHVCRVFDVPQPPPVIHPPTLHSPTPAHPFKNDSIFKAMKTFVLGPSSKTAPGMDEIIRLVSSGELKGEELAGFSAETELRHLDNFAATSGIAGGPWKNGSVKIKMPCTRSNNPSFTTEAEAPDFEVSGIRYRSLVDLVVSKVKDPSAAGSFVRQPFTEWWCPPGSRKPVRLYGEAYSSDVAVQLFEEVKNIPPPIGHSEMESVVVLLMLGSDATHLASFGTASLWPLYLFFGNMSKYDSSKPSEFPAWHLAYLPKV
jgi:Plavaka transposase